MFDTGSLGIRLCRLGLLALACAMAGTAGAEGLDALLGRVATAYGGDGVPATIVQTGHTMSNARGEGPLRRVYRDTGQFRIDLHYGSGIETRILDGARAWQHNRPMSGAFRGALALQAARLALPWKLLAARDTLRDAGEQTLADGRILHFVELPLAEGLKLVAEIDPASGRILRSRGIIAGERGEMVFGTVYEDFRTAQGRLYPAVEHHFAMGRLIGRSVIDAVEFDVPVDDRLFRPDTPGMI